MRTRRSRAQKGKVGAWGTGAACLGAAQLGTTGPPAVLLRSSAALQSPPQMGPLPRTVTAARESTWRLAIRLLFFSLRVIFLLQGERTSENSYVVPKVGKVHESCVIR